MFKNLTDFTYKRNRKEAIGFYIAYFILIVLLGGLSGGIVGLIINQQDSYAVGFRVGNIVLIPLSGLLAYFGGALLGLIFVTYLTTRDNQVNLVATSGKTESPQPFAKIFKSS